MPFPLESGAFYGLLSFKYFERSVVPGFGGCGSMSGAPRRASGDGRRRDTANLSVLPGKVETEFAFYPQERPFPPTGSLAPEPGNQASPQWWRLESWVLVHMRTLGR